MKTSLIIVAALIIGGAGPVLGQDTLAAPAPAPQGSTVMPFEGWVGGASIGLPGYGHETVPELFMIGLTFTHLRPRGLGPDIWVGVMPRAFTEGIGVVGARSNLALSLPLGRQVVLLPGAGVSALGAVSTGGGGGVLGYNAGLAAIFAAGPVGLRIGATFHRMFGDSGEPIWLIDLAVLDLANVGTYRR